MKKILLLVFIFNVQYVLSQVSLSSIKEITFYGIEFQTTRLVGAKESDEDFKKMFVFINERVVDNWFEVDDLFSRQRLTIDANPTVRNNSKVDFNNWRNKQLATKEQLSEIVKSYELSQKVGYGAVLFCLELNKMKDEGIYVMVIFDIATREILDDTEIVGEQHLKAWWNSFGLGNFWSTSILDAIENLPKKYKKKGIWK